MITLSEFLSLEHAERAQYFATAGEVLGLPIQLIEKDFWVSFVLYLLFNEPAFSGIFTFKGGTSLSKCYEVTRRFSEDIDLTIEKNALGITADKLPTSESSFSQQKKLLDALREAGSAFVNNVILPNLRSLIAAHLADTRVWKLELDSSDSEQLTLLFHYPTDSQGSGYISHIVKIEFGARGEHWPTESRGLQSYVHTALPNILEPMPAIIRVFSPVRTLWEKATILHSLASEIKPKTIRQSRHIYDLFSLCRTVHLQDAYNNITLLEDVCRHKMLYFRSPKARYEDVLKGELKLIPSTGTLEALKEDYQKMGEMLFDEPFKWETMIETLEGVQQELNLILKAKCKLLEN